MIISSKIYLARTGLQPDAFYRARCNACGRAPMILSPDGRSTVCAACEHAIAEGTALRYAKLSHCSQCRAVAGLWVGSGLGRCWPCHLEWRELGKPEQTSKSVIRLRRQVKLRDLFVTVPDVDFNALLARYRNGR